MLHTTMTEKNLTLFCIVEGESVSHAFKLKNIPSSDDVDDLKDAIKAKKTVAFSDIDADQLTLLRVSIPKVKQSSAITIDALDDKTELDEPRTIHPPAPSRASTPLPGYLSDQSRPITPIQLKSVPKDHIEKELTIVLEGVNHHHITESIDPKDVESSQRERLGPFYKRTLPYHETATDTSLVMLGLELDKQASTSDGETLHFIVKGDIGRYGDHRVVAMVAPSGSGKTATVVDLASKHFVIYCVCCISSPTISPGFKDPNFILLAEDIESMYRTVIHRNQGGSQDAKAIDSEVKTLAGQRVQLEFLARLLFLQLLLQNKPDLEPQQFFREQTTSGASTIGELIYKLREYDNHTIHALLDKVQTKLRSLLASKRLGLVIALDEAQVAVTGILCEKLISPSALLKNRNALFDSKNQIQSRFRRGFLTPLSATLVILGTALSLQDADHVYSAIAKPTNFSRITEFPQFDDNDEVALSLCLMNLSFPKQSRIILLRRTPTSRRQSGSGCVFEQFMMKVFSETFNNKPLSDWPHQPPISDMCTALVGKVDIVAWREPGLDQGTTHRQMTMTDFMDSHVNHQSIRNNKPTAPFFFPKPKPSGPDLLFFIRIDGARLVPVFVQMKLHQGSSTFSEADWMDALSTVSAPKIESHAIDFRRYCPDNVYISMVVAYPTRWTEWTSNLPSLSDLPRDASGVQQVVINVGDNNFADIYPKEHVEFIDRLKTATKRNATDSNNGGGAGHLKKQRKTK
ncbi:MAG: hypothetical protein J3R72DRAFT_480919 [Linnemannia gamsii]|nr:MAG: hypothetical protein J3R72DRAFT_480919 [Linnemannia gamsii]